MTSRDRRLRKIERWRRLVSVACVDVLMVMMMLLLLLCLWHVMLMLVACSESIRINKSIWIMGLV